MRYWLSSLVLFVFCLSVLADPPPELDYQGKILLDDLPFTGDGYFKFALSDDVSTTNYWSNDSTATGEPSASITQTVFNGVFSVQLGDLDMDMIDPEIFSNGDDLYLRVWFSDDDSTFSEMLPSQRMVSHGYAVNADRVDGLDASDIATAAATNVTLAGDVTGPAGANVLGGDTVTSSEIVDGSIVDADVRTTAAIDPGKIAGTALTEGTSFGGDVSGVFSNLALTGDAVGSPEIADGSIVDADVSATAAILGSKIQSGTTGNVGVVQFAAGATAPLRAVDDSDPLLNGFGIINTFTAAAPNSAVSITGTNGVTISNSAPNTVTVWGPGPPPLPAPVLSNTIYVALNGTPAGPGSIEMPYDTAQAGYDAAAAMTASGTVASVVLMGGGSYGPLTMHAGLVHVLGHSRSEIDDLMVVFGAPSPPAPGPAMASKQRVENIVVTGPAMVLPNGFGAWIKFHNCRFGDGLLIDESFVEVQDCVIQRRDLSSPAAMVDTGTGAAITQVGFYQSSILSTDTNPAMGALTVGGAVQDFEVIGCSIVNEDGATGPAVVDMTPGIPPGMALHLYSHNVIKGPASSGAGFPAFADPALPPLPSFALVQNTIHGDVGNGVLPPGMVGRAQFFSNNTIYGLINYPAPAVGVPFGWAQAGVGPGLDGAGNLENPGAIAPFGPAILPSHWDD